MQRYWLTKTSTSSGSSKPPNPHPQQNSLSRATKLTFTARKSNFYNEQSITLKI